MHFMFIPKLPTQMLSSAFQALRILQDGMLRKARYDTILGKCYIYYEGLL